MSGVFHLPQLCFFIEKLWCTVEIALLVCMSVIKCAVKLLHTDTKGLWPGTLWEDSCGDCINESEAN